MRSTSAAHNPISIFHSPSLQARPQEGEEQSGFLMAQGVRVTGVDELSGKMQANRPDLENVTSG